MAQHIRSWTYPFRHLGFENLVNTDRSDVPATVQGHKLVGTLFFLTILPPEGRASGYRFLDQLETRGVNFEKNRTLRAFSLVTEIFEAIVHS
jgi:hypothetical protein